MTASFDAWTTADGRQIPLVAMTDRHLRNVQKILRKRKEEQEALLRWSIKNGSDAAEPVRNLEITLAWLHVLQEEFDRRGLKGPQVSVRI